MDVSDRRLQVRLTQQAKIPANSFAFIGIFAFAGFVGSLRRISLRFCLAAAAARELAARPDWDAGKIVSDCMSVPRKDFGGRAWGLRGNEGTLGAAQTRQGAALHPPKGMIPFGNLFCLRRWVTDGTWEVV